MKEQDSTLVNEDIDLSLKLFVVLSKAQKVIMDRSVKDMKRHGLSPSEFAILELLYHKGKFPLQQIGDKILVTSGSITYNIDKLEKKELLRRISCPSDRRVTYAEITERGTELFNDIFPEHAEVVKASMNGLTAEEKKLAIGLIKKLGTAAQKQS
ncbi:MarR family transcriptional regulator [Paenibacillus chitinolyticus]|uniref:MarR family transcriptional regulator n=1 Tax=Paenibacillus chitinolyticus TaxID=79263 RepID=A0A410WSK1_9BACL|nr:MarR family transcriptional regulator [Paenibacillus chitinolyticus]MCY9589031.1 MarR family transcriptional regulator [Paenibacillus chitinolyticus]MCY9595485.1 MarR family transcriptional regulator [Paenibacillus chitinolyticus]QAV17257.1 MarR family transcriptional regulator [Paenibacillus chitinolyticus]